MIDDDILAQAEAVLAACRAAGQGVTIRRAMCDGNGEASAGAGTGAARSGRGTCIPHTAAFTLS